jgi:hypothetical protein
MFLTPTASGQGRPIQKNAVGLATPKASPGTLDAARAAGDMNGLQQVLDSLATQLNSKLQETRKFQVVARADLPEIIGEQALAESGNVDQDDQAAARAFRLAGAAYTAVVEVDSFDDSEQVLRGDGGVVLSRRRMIEVGASISIYDSTTGALLESPSLQPVEMIDTERRQPGVEGDGMNFNSLYRAAAETLAERAAQRITDVIFPAKVVAFSNGVVTINRGDGTGIERGQTWTVYFVGPAIIDPDTGENLGAEEIPLGEVQIVRVLPRLTQARLIGDDPGIEVGMVVRPAIDPGQFD